MYTTDFRCYFCPHSQYWWEPAIIGLLTIFCIVTGCNYQASARDGWEQASAEEVGLDSTLLQKLLQDAREGRFPNLHAIVVVKNNQLIVDEYFNDYDIETRQYTASVSKSIGSMLLGIAMDKGLLPGLADDALEIALLEFFPDYKAELVDEKDKAAIKFKHVLSMSAGLEWDEQTFPYNDDRNDWVRASQSEDPARFLLERPLVSSPGTVFNYNGGLSILLSHLVQQASGMPADEFAKQHLFDPLGITDYEWEQLPSGLTDTDGGLHLRPRDMAKLGQLYLNGGVWNGDRIVSREWIAESTREHIINARAPNYGLQWWCGDFYYQGRSEYIYMASGHGGQKIYVIPSHEMVVVLTHAVFDNPNGELHNTSIMSRYILPSANPLARNSLPTKSPVVSLAHYTGVYQSPLGNFEVQLQDGKLFVLAENEPTMELVHLAGSHFRAVVVDLLDIDFVFDTDDVGNVLGGSVSQGFTSESFARHQNDGELR